MTGGNGGDTCVVEPASGVAIERPNAGTDTVVSSAPSHNLAANVGNPPFRWTAAFKGTGNDLTNAIAGGIGADNLSGVRLSRRSILRSVEPDPTLTILRT